MPGFSGATKAIRMNAAALQAALSYTLASEITEAGLTPKSNFAANIKLADEHGLLTAAEKKKLKKINTNGNLAKHEWTEKFFNRFVQDEDEESTDGETTDGETTDGETSDEE